MKKSRFIFKCLSFFVFISFFIFEASCSKQDSSSKAEQFPDLTITQGDIMLLIEHKRTIDAITEKYDKKMAEVQPSAAQKLIEDGKSEINKYLESKGMNPEIFMKKSKKILRAYLAFAETSNETMQKRIELLKQNDASPNEIEMGMQAYKKAGGTFFREMTQELSPKEMELIKSNLSTIASVAE
ncbi:hypothetical protein J6Z19_03790 [bacterium]|nr:hypothetical protein [bacterium]